MSNMLEIITECVQWLLLFLLLNSLGVSRKKNKELKESLNGTQRMVDELWRDSANVLLNVCCYCAQDWVWNEKEQLEDGGAWVHSNGEGKLVFCGSTPETTPYDSKEIEPK